MAKSPVMSTMSQQEARGILEEVSQIQSATRARLYAHGWQWMVVWALTFFGAALTGIIPAWQDFAGVYWLYAVPVALGLTAWISWREESRSPVRQRELPYWIIGLGITVGCFGASALLPESAVVVVIWVILGLGFAAFAWLERVIPAARMLAAMAVLSGVLGMVVEDTFQLYPALGFAFGAALAGIIAGMRIRAER